MTKFSNACYNMTAYTEATFDEATCMLLMTGTGVPPLTANLSAILDKMVAVPDIVTRLVTDAGVLYYENEEGVRFEIPAETITSLTANSDGSYSYVNESGTISTIAAPTPETVTTIVALPGGGFRYTNEAGTVFDQPAPEEETITSLTVNATSCQIEYLNEAGVTQLATIPSSNYTYDAALRRLTIVDAKNVVTVVDLAGDCPVLGVDGCNVTLECNGIKQTAVLPNSVKNITNDNCGFGMLRVEHCDGTIGMVNVGGSDSFSQTGPSQFTHTAVDGQALSFDICQIMRTQCPGVSSVVSAAGGSSLVITKDDGSVTVIDLVRENFLNAASYNQATKQLTFTLVDGTVVGPVDLSDLVDDVTTLDLGNGTFSVNGTVIDVCKLQADGGCMPPVVQVTSTGMTTTLDGVTQTLNVCDIMKAQCPGVKSIAFDPATNTFTITDDNDNVVTAAVTTDDVKATGLVLDANNQLRVVMSDGSLVGPADLSSLAFTLVTTDNNNGTFTINGNTFDVCKMAKDGDCLGDKVTVTPTGATITSPSGAVTTLDVCAIAIANDCVGDKVTTTPTGAVITGPTGGTSILDVCAIMQAQCPGVSDVLWDQGSTTFNFIMDDGTTKPVQLTFPTPTVDIKLDAVNFDEDDNSISFTMSDGTVLGPIDLKDFLTAVNVVDNNDGTYAVNGQVIDICKAVSDGGCAGDKVSITSTGAVFLHPDGSTEILNVCDIAKANNCVGDTVNVVGPVVTVNKPDGSQQVADICAIMADNCPGVTRILFDAVSNTFTVENDDGSVNTHVVALPPSTVDVKMSGAAFDSATNQMTFTLSDGSTVGPVDLSALVGTQTQVTATYNAATCRLTINVDGVITTVPLDSQIAKNAAGDKIVLTDACGNTSSVDIGRCDLGIPRVISSTLPDSTVTAPGAVVVGTINVPPECTCEMLHITVSGQLLASA